MQDEKKSKRFRLDRDSYVVMITEKSLTVNRFRKQRDTCHWSEDCVLGTVNDLPAGNTESGEAQVSPGD